MKIREREEFAELMFRILNPLKTYYSKEKAWLKVGHTSAHYPDEAAWMERCKRFIDRAMKFGKDFAYWFAEDGSAVPYGRSQTYRFAQASFYSACVMANIEPLPLGTMKGIIVRNLEYWLQKPIFDNAGVLTIGYGYPNLTMVFIEEPLINSKSEKTV